MARPRKSRVYWRTRNGTRRAWFDGRDYADVGGGLEPLTPEGEKYATTDPDVALDLAARRLAELEQTRKAGPAPATLSAMPTLAEYAEHHLEMKAVAGKTTERWMETLQKRLERAAEFFGAGRALDDIRTTDVQRWALYLAQQPGRVGEKMADGTVRHHLNALSGLYARAISEAVVPATVHPVRDLLDKPTGSADEADFLTVPEAALLLEAARLYMPKRDDIAISFMYELLAAFLLTGGRKNEVLGLLTSDVALDRGVVMFRNHPHRRLKTKTSRRAVPLFPQLKAVLRPYLKRTKRKPGDLLFPGRTGGMITGLRGPLEAIAGLAGLDPDRVHLHALRHTYCAARLQTLDGGSPISAFTVSRELGHGSMSLVERIYGHVAGTRHRSEHVEFRVGQHRKALAAKLQVMKQRVQARSAAG